MEEDVMLKNCKLDLSLKKGELSSAHEYCTFDWIHNAIDNLTAHKDFKVGDVVVKFDSSGKVIKNNDGTINKYVVIYVDSHGLVFVKQMLNVCTLFKTVTCITAESYLNGKHYKHDPEYIELLMLGKEDEYDPFSHNKLIINKRIRCRRFNDKFKITELSKIENMFAIMSATRSGEFWSCSRHYIKSNEESPIKYVFTGVIAGTYFFDLYKGDNLITTKLITVDSMFKEVCKKNDTFFFKEQPVKISEFI